MLILEKWLTLAIQEGVEQGEGFLIAVPAEEEDASVVKIGAIGLEEGGMTAAILDTDAPFLVGEGIDAVHGLIVAEHLMGQLEQRGGILLQMKVQVLVALEVLPSHGIRHRAPNLEVPTVHAVREQLPHLLLCPIQILAALDNGLGLLNLFLLGIQTWNNGYPQKQE